MSRKQLRLGQKQNQCHESNATKEEAKTASRTQRRKQRHESKDENSPTKSPHTRARSRAVRTHYRRKQCSRKQHRRQHTRMQCPKSITDEGKGESSATRGNSKAAQREQTKPGTYNGPKDLPPCPRKRRLPESKDHRIYTSNINPVRGIKVFTLQRQTRPNQWMHTYPQRQARLKGPQHNCQRKISLIHWIHTHPSTRQSHSGLQRA